MSAKTLSAVSASSQKRVCTPLPVAEAALTSIASAFSSFIATSTVAAGAGWGGRSILFFSIVRYPGYRILN